MGSKRKSSKSKQLSLEMSWRPSGFSALGDEGRMNVRLQKKKRLEKIQKARHEAHEEKLRKEKLRKEKSDLHV